MTEKKEKEKAMEQKKPIEKRTTKEEDAKYPVNYQDVSKKSLKELLELKDAVKFLMDYYNNFAQANTGNYEFNSEEIYQNAKNLTERYGKAYNYLIYAIETKVLLELY